MSDTDTSGNAPGVAIALLFRASGHYMDTSQHIKEKVQTLREYVWTQLEVFILNLLVFSPVKNVLET